MPRVTTPGFRADFWAEAGSAALPYRTTRTPTQPLSSHAATPLSFHVTIVSLLASQHVPYRGRSQRAARTPHLVASINPHRKSRLAVNLTVQSRNVVAFAPKPVHVFPNRGA
jgi:hypothetical protein